ncbi:MAG TPA: efflux RND transporter periplasmic adaptor subunit [Holophagaceae bacterium]|nr:efflux RND transporter periplasmic adaptor subunit [Holophagaceae bacterium]
MNRRLLSIGIPSLIVVIIAGAAIWHRGQRNAELDRQAAVKHEGLVAVTTATVETRPFRPSLAFTGTLLAVNRAELKAEVPGRVTRVAFQEGDPVKSGAILATQDEDDLSLGAQAAEAQYAVAQAQAAQAKRDADRAAALLEKRSVTRQFAQQTETAYNAAVASERAAASEAGAARVRLKKARITAPFEGQVGRRLVQPGDVLVPGQPVFEVVDNRKLEIQADLPASGMALVKPGQAVRFRVPGFENPFDATLTQVSPSLSKDGRNLRVRIEVPNPDRLLKSGTFVEGVILGTGEQTLPALPSSLVKAQDRNADVFVVEQGLAHRKSVVLGPEQDGWRPVQGLGIGEAVVDQGVDLVTDGARLKVVGARAAESKPDGKADGKAR